MSERDKKEQEIIDNIDRAINELVYDKVQVIKAYNYYHGKRDAEQFRHLEENYGLGTATSIEFIPMARKHIDALIGEYLSTPALPRISCKDQKTLSNIFKDKQNKINSGVSAELKKIMNSAVASAITGDQNNVVDKEVEKRLNDLVESLDRNFVSEYEIAGQNIVNWAMQARVIDFLNQRKILLTDLLAIGMAYYKVCPSSDDTNVRLRVLNPVNTFIDRNPESPYLKDSSRSVIREFLTKDQILARYGKYLKKEDLDQLDSLQDLAVDGSATYMRSFESTTGNIPESDGVLGGFEVTPLFPFERNATKNFRTFPVYEVEWLKTEKENDEYVMNRYEGIRISTGIYVPIGKAKNIVRHVDSKNMCSLSVNGMFYSDRNGDPYSLVLKTANLQDKNDILYFYRDNMISESGTTGDWLDVAHLPTFLGADITERLLKWKAYKKTGVALYDSSQEGTPMMNTGFNGYDDSLKLQAIQAIDLAIQRNEDTCSMITGVFREKLGGIEQKDAVTNVQVGVRQSSYITKQYYQIMDLLTREILIDILDTCKIVYKNGMSGVIVLGERLNQIFTALPEYYSFTDYDIHIADSAEVVKDQELIKQFGMEMTKGQMLDPDTLLEIITAKSLTVMKNEVKTSLQKKRAENNQLGQLSQQVQQLDQQLKDATQEAQKLKQEVERLNSQKIQLENDKLNHEKELDWYKARSENDIRNAELDEERKRVQLEGLQLLDANDKNDEIRNT